MEPTSIPPIPTPFSQRTQLKIRDVCQNRCVVCLRHLGDVGQCAHILNSSDKAGKEMVSFATGIGILAPKYSQSAVENGVVLCSSCHQDFFTRNLVTFSPPKEILQYLVDYVENGNTTPIHELIDQLFLPEALHGDLPNPASILPFLGLYTLVALDLKRLKNIDFAIFQQGKLSQLLNGHWIPVPPNTTASAIARIYDPTGLRPTDRGLCSPLDLSTVTPLEKCFWRLPTRFTAMLSVFLYRVAHIPNNKCEEIKLAIKLRGLLTLRRIGSLSSPIGRPSGRGGDPGGGRKLGDRLEKQASVRNREGLSNDNKGASCQNDLKPISSACLVKAHRHPVYMPRTILPRIHKVTARLLHVVV